MLTLRSSLFYVGAVLSVAVFALLALITPVLPYRRRAFLLLYWNRWILWWLQKCCNVRIVIRGLMPPRQPSVIVSNHQSALETVFLQLYLQPVACILKRELLRMPGFGWGLSQLQPIAIDRGKPREALRQILDQGQKRLANGLSVLVFPEGTRQCGVKPGRFARSAAKLACETGVDLIPVAHNAGDLWRDDDWRKRPGCITVVIGPPIASAGKSPAELTELAYSWITNELAVS